MSERGTELVAKGPPARNTGKISKNEFEIDLEKEKIICPEGKVTTKCQKSKNSEGEVTRTFIFSKQVCNRCPRKDECTTAKNTGRTINVGPYEGYLREARKRQKTKQFKEIYNRRRPPIERKIAELIHHGLRKTRYIGTKKSRLQVLLTTAAVNLKLFFKEPEDKKINFDIKGTVSATL